MVKRKAKSQSGTKREEKPKWWLYQEQAAEFFRGLGLKAETNARLGGARGEHNVDVLVTGSFRGLPFMWVVECKCWKSNVPKEKVLALSSIVQDVGADRGILLSEKGFQAGAIQLATLSNISLTSISLLREETSEHVKEGMWSTFAYRIARVRVTLRKKVKAQVGGNYRPAAEVERGLMSADNIIRDTLSGGHPLIDFGKQGGPMFLFDFVEIAAAIERLIAPAEQWTAPEADSQQADVTSLA